MMRTHDSPAVETPDFLLAALERANDAVVIVDSDLHVRCFDAAAELIWGWIALKCSVVMPAVWGSRTFDSFMLRRRPQVR